MTTTEQMDRAWDLGISSAQRRFWLSKRAADAARHVMDHPQSTLHDVASFIVLADRNFEDFLKLEALRRVAKGCGHE